jgi:hypothetical protein
VGIKVVAHAELHRVVGFLPHWIRVRECRVIHEAEESRSGSGIETVTGPTASWLNTRTYLIGSYRRSSSGMACESVCVESHSGSQASSATGPM